MENGRQAWGPVLLVGLVVWLVSLPNESAVAATLNVANNGVDSAACGAAKARAQR